VAYLKSLTLTWLLDVVRSGGGSKKQREEDGKVHDLWRLMFGSMQSSL
jgi:hypothetical protein